MEAPRGYRERLVLMDRERLARTLSRMASEIVERHRDQRRIVLVGVRSRGVPMARRLARRIREIAGVLPPVGALDITLYRDDLTLAGARPILRATEIPAPIDDRTLIVVDDVLFTGRSVRGALDQLIDFGRPARIELAVLVDRGHRELPIHADYVGRTVTTAHDDIVQVMLEEQDGQDGVYLFERTRRRRTAPAKRAPRRRAARLRRPPRSKGARRAARRRS
jgi:pyrimidine operon attenuation protein/uracil phosphoribosyltransferase